MDVWYLGVLKSWGWLWVVLRCVEALGLVVGLTASCHL